jgi:cytochrome c oxidase subunit II
MSTSPRKRPASEAIVAGGVVVALVAIVVLAYVSGAMQTLYPPEPVTEEAVLISNLYDIVFGLAVVIFVAVEGLIVWSVFRYRRRPGDVELPPQTHGNNLVEVLWTLIPTVIVLFLFVISWDTLQKVDAVSAPAQRDLTVRALAGQFQWQFEYLDAAGNHLATETVPEQAKGGGMAVPVGKNVFVELVSGDVIHAWYVPHFLFKRDVVPGQNNHFEFRLEEDEAGEVFHGQCAELCGTGHRVMLFDVLAMSPTDFDAWLDALIEKENATPPPPPSGQPEALEVVAKNIAFDTHELQVPADSPFAITLTNEDSATVPHDIDIRQGPGAPTLQDEPTTPGGQSTQYNYDPLPAGTYQFFCSVHPGVPGMEGTLTVQ